MAGGDLSIAVLAKRGEAFVVLAELVRRGSLTSNGFTAAAGVASRTAALLREDLRELGLIDVKVIDERGGLQTHRITATPLGEIIGEVLVELDDVLRAATSPAPPRGKPKEEIRRDVRAVGDRWRAKKEE